MSHEEVIYDVVVVGFGGAGACAAIEAATRGARVLVLDRGHGGGATALSGGVVYAGGGTRYQREAGFNDTPANMFDYLKTEVGDAVSGATLRRFCDESPAMIEWLESLGVPFAGGVPPYKTSYPIDKYYLYFSGNEKAYPYSDEADPAPRGHRTYATGLGSGAALYDRLRDTALELGVTFVPLARAESLIVEDGRAVGVRYRVLADVSAGEKHDKAMARRAKVTRRGNKIGNWLPVLGRMLNKRAEKLWQANAVTAEARAAAVILAAGGFVYNREWVRKWAPTPFNDANPLGTVGDDGSGIALGVEAGGATARMERLTGWRFLTPPSGFIEGVSVGEDGNRIANEDLYGATFTDIMVRDHEGRGRVVFDSTQWRRARGQLSEQVNLFQGLQAHWLFRVGHKKAPSLEKLAKKLGVEPDAMVRTVQAYNLGLRGAGDPAHKKPDSSSPVVDAPFYGINISIKNKPAYPVSSLTLGGLRVDEETGEVLREDGRTIPGLYAAGRNAVGICSTGYISGLSISDCVFSGRRAGGHAATTSRDGVASTVPLDSSD